MNPKKCGLLVPAVQIMNVALTVGKRQANQSLTFSQIQMNPDELLRLWKTLSKFIASGLSGFCVTRGPMPQSHILIIMSPV